MSDTEPDIYDPDTSLSDCGLIPESDMPLAVLPPQPLPTTDIMTCLEAEHWDDLAAGIPAASADEESTLMCKTGLARFAVVDYLIAIRPLFVGVFIEDLGTDAFSDEEDDFWD